MLCSPLSSASAFWKMHRLNVVPISFCTTAVCSSRTETLIPPFVLSNRTCWTLTQLRNAFLLRLYIAQKNFMKQGSCRADKLLRYQAGKGLDSCLEYVVLAACGLEYKSGTLGLHDKCDRLVLECKPARCVHYMRCMMRTTVGAPQSEMLARFGHFVDKPCSHLQSML